MARASVRSRHDRRSGSAEQYPLATGEDPRHADADSVSRRGVSIPASGIRLPTMATSSTVPRIQYLRVQNFRALRNIELKNITRLTVLLGPNGSGKTTRFDVFNFLSECFQGGLRQAWDKRGRGKELKTRGADGPVASRSSTARARPHRSSPTTCPSTRVARGR
jgi:hypothetical protein